MPVPTHVDVLIVGAGISGIGAAWHLRHQSPGRSFLLLDSQREFGGTWRTHRYPGTRSDSDLHTFGYRFKPWPGVPIATAPEILAYLGEVIAENDLARHIRYGITVTAARWSSDAARWTVEFRDGETGATGEITAGFLWMCQGYYRHAQGYTPDFPGMGDFAGRVVHPQTWPEDLDYAGKRVVVIGSGATAATLIPAIADAAAHVTMLQRSPTWFFTRRNADELAETLRGLKVDEAWVHEIMRRKKLRETAEFTRLALEQPDVAKAQLLEAVRAEVGEACDVDRHFTPRYDPWRQRIAFIPDGDMFRAIRSGRASVVTDTVARFERDGVRTGSGELLPADIVVTATGFDLCVFGDIAFSLDGAPLDWAQTVTYRGMMFTGVPNLVWVFGYLRASWTLRADLVGDFVPRLLAHMDARGARSVRPELRAADADMPIGPWIDPENFNPGYLLRGLDKLPKAGAKREWRHTQDYMSEKDEFPAIDLDDPAFVYT